MISTTRYLQQQFGAVISDGDKGTNGSLRDMGQTVNYKPLFTILHLH